MVVHPLRGEQPDLIKIFPVVLRQPFVAHGPIEALDIGILLWFARLNVFDPDSFAIRLGLDQAADVLWSVVATNPRRLPAPLNHLIKRTDDPLGG